MNEPRPWHRLFGLSWVDFFHGMSVRVELEKDLSLKQQRLDVVLIRKDAAPLSRRLPDGFEELAAHNLVSFKSYQEALDGWALNELIGHYVNYRKQISPSMQDLLPETDFRVFAVTVRSPQALMRQTTLTPVQAGVYEVRHFTGRIRVIVVHELPQREHNAMLHLFSAQPDLLQYGRTYYRQCSEETSTVLQQLFTMTHSEVLAVASLLEQEDLFQKMTPEDVLDQLTRESIKRVLSQLTRESIKRILSNSPIGELLEKVSAEERLRGLPAEERLKGLPAEERLKGLSPEEVLAALSPETRAALAQRLKDDPSLSKPKPSAAEESDPQP